ncbi:MAG: hypothetical protein J6L23_04275 [Clostridia bacterium]|nr:hypothetical protein [Clostridia bacterium]
MKKLMFFVLAVVMVATFVVSASAVDYGTVEINKVTTAPTIDGAVSENEYPTVIKYDSSKTYWNYKSDEDAANYDVVLYMGWDAENFYTAITAKATTARTYDNATPSNDRPYIFDRRHVMSAVVTGNPTDSKYQPADGQAWGWSDAYGSGYGNEWTITAQPDGTNAHGDHFGSVTGSIEYKVTVATNGTEVYEQKIPWTAFTGGTVTAAEGTVFGYAFTLACEEVDFSGEEDSCTYACFGAGISGYKNFAEYVALTLAGEKAPEPDTSEPATEPSEPSEPTTPPETGDMTMVFVLVALVSLAGAVVVSKKRA